MAKTKERVLIHAPVFSFHRRYWYGIGCSPKGRAGNRTKAASEAGSTATRELSEAAVKAFDFMIQDLALEEHEVGALARRILRMKRDNAPKDEIMPMAVHSWNRFWEA